MSVPLLRLRGSLLPSRCCFAGVRRTLFTTLPKAATAEASERSSKAEDEAQATQSDSKAELASSPTIETDEPLWKDPYRHALPKQTVTYTDYKEANVDWDYVERLLPKRIIPDAPKGCGILPSGWRPPQEPAPELPYYVRRNPKHMPSIYLETRRDVLNVKTMEFEYEEVVVLKGVDGDVFACEHDLKAFLEAKVGHPVATNVDELKGMIKTKGAHRKFVEAFVFESGF